MSSMREGLETTGESKEDIIKAVLPQRAPFDKEEGLVYIYLCSPLAETGIYLLFLGCNRSRCIN